MRQHSTQTTPHAYRLTRTSADEREKIVARLQSSLDYIATGRHPGPAEWQDLADVVNIIETLVEPLGMLDRDETMPVLQTAHASVVAAAQRYEATGKMRLDGPGLEALRQLVEWYEGAQKHLSLWHMTEARRLVQQGCKDALAGKVAPGVVVVSL